MTLISKRARVIKHKAGATYLGQSSILVTEVRVLREGVCSAIQACFDKLIIKGDN